MECSDPFSQYLFPIILCAIFRARKDLLEDYVERFGGFDESMIFDDICMLPLSASGGSNWTRIGPTSRFLRRSISC